MVIIVLKASLIPAAISMIVQQAFTPTAAAAQTKHPVTQALVSMTQTFIDTIIVCTMTGLVLILTNSWVMGQTGAELTTIAFSKGLPGNWGNNIVAL